MDLEETLSAGLAKRPGMFAGAAALVAVYVVSRLSEKPFPFDDSFISFRVR